MVAEHPSQETKIEFGFTPPLHEPWFPPPKTPESWKSEPVTVPLMFVPLPHCTLSVQPVCVARQSVSLQLPASDQLPEKFLQPPLPLSVPASPVPVPVDVALQASRHEATAKTESARIIRLQSTPSAPTALGPGPPPGNVAW